MYRSHCGELNASHINTEVTLAGFQKIQRQGIHELDWFAWPLWNNTIDFDEGQKNGFDLQKTLGREFVIQVRESLSNVKLKTKHPNGWNRNISYRTNYTKCCFNSFHYRRWHGWWGRHSNEVPLFRHQKESVKIVCCFVTKLRWK
jgi:hypothetical protein